MTVASYNEGAEREREHERERKLTSHSSAPLSPLPSEFRHQAPGMLLASHTTEQGGRAEKPQGLPNQALRSGPPAGSNHVGEPPLETRGVWLTAPATPLFSQAAAQPTQPMHGPAQATTASRTNSLPPNPRHRHSTCPSSLAVGSLAVGSFPGAQRSQKRSSLQMPLGAGGQESELLSRLQGSAAYLAELHFGGCL